MPLGFDRVFALRSGISRTRQPVEGGLRELKPRETWDGKRYTLHQRFVLPVGLSPDELPQLLKALNVAMRARSAEVGLGLLAWHGNQLKLGPVPLVDLGGLDTMGKGRDLTSSQEIEGGLLVGRPGGAELFRTRLTDGGVLIEASLDHYQPRVPKGVYLVTQARLHQAVVRRAVRAVARAYLAAQAA